MTLVRNIDFSEDYDFRVVLWDASMEDSQINKILDGSF